MKTIPLIIGIAIYSSSVYAKSFLDKSPLDTSDLAICTAAAMKSGQGIDLYTRWSDALNARYKVIFPKLSEKERSDYTVGRIIDKRKSLNRDGIGTTPAYLKYYINNCKDFAP